MPTTASVVVLQYDDEWNVAQLLGQHRNRDTNDWRCGVRYSVARIRRRQSGNPAAAARLHLVEPVVRPVAASTPSRRQRAA